MCDLIHTDEGAGSGFELEVGRSVEGSPGLTASTVVVRFPQWFRREWELLEALRSSKPVFCGVCRARVAMETRLAPGAGMY
jgi:hypothetical protein